MRHHRARILVAAATAAMFAVPAAPSASASQAIAGGGSGPPAIVQPTHRSGGETDWALIGGGSAGVIALLGAGVAVTRRRSRTTVLPQSGLAA